MGTNYYAIPRATSERKEKIKKAIDQDKFEKAKDLIGGKVHIGKSSVGWEFIFDHNNWYYFGSDKDEIIKFLDRCNIYDEDEQYIFQEEFWKMVEAKKGGLNDIQCKEKWHEMYGSEPKPYYMWQKNYGNIYVDDLCFSTYPNFS